MSKSVNSSIVSKSLKGEIIIHGIKIIDVGYSTVINFLMGFIISSYINLAFEYINKFDPTKKPNKYKLFGEIIGQLCIIGLLIYILRNFYTIIPFPLNGIYGYQHSRMFDLPYGEIALSFGIFNAQIVLKAKINYLLSIENSKSA